MGTLQTVMAEVAAGLREAAAELGSSFSVYRSTIVRPVAGVYPTPIAGLYFIGPTLASFASNYRYAVPVNALKPQRVAVVDPEAVLIGDYLYDGVETYFISNMAPLLPIAAVLCNRSITLRRQADVARGRPGRVGDVGRLGNVSTGANASEFVALAGWPASVLYSGRGGKTLSGLPTDDTAAQWTILLPALPLTVAASDIIEDDLGRRFVVTAAEPNATGLRVIANQAEH